MSDVADLIPVVDEVARFARLMYCIEEDEARGILLAAVAERVNDYLTLYREGRTSLIRKRLRNVAGRYAQKQRIRQQVETDQYFYEPAYIRLFLPHAFDRADWTAGPPPEDQLGEWATGEAVDTALDIRAAWGRLRDWQWRAIVARHLTPPGADGEPDWDAIAQRLGRKNAKSAREAYLDATRQLAIEMNDAHVTRVEDHSGPGSRSKMNTNPSEY